MTHRAVGAAQNGTGESEPCDLDGVLGSGVPGAVAVDLDEFEIFEDVARESSCCGDAILERHEGSEFLGHGIDRKPTPQNLMFRRPTRQN